MTKVFTAGDKSRAHCYRCLDIVHTTILQRDVRFSDGQGIAKNIIVGVCDDCGSIVAIPAQSVKAIAQSRASMPLIGQARTDSC